MAELNDKLITYGNLSTFYDNLQEKGCIEEVSELPNASENKDKFFRLDNGEKDVYAAKLLSSETITTNRLPDAQQIDKAYIYNTNTETFAYYKGTWKLSYDGGVLDVFYWSGENDWFYTYDNTENISNESLVINENSLTWVSTDETNKITVVSESKNEIDTITSELVSLDLYPIPATYNAPESAQIGNAYFSDGDKYYYNGVEYTLNYTDGVSIKVYGWVYEGNTSPSLYSTKKASEMYYQNIYDGQGYIAGKYTDVVAYFIDYETYPIVNNTITLDYPLSEAENALGDFQSMYIPQLNAPDSEQVDNAYITVDNKNFYYIGTLSDDSEGITRYCYKDSNDVIVGWGNTYNESENRSPENLYASDYNNEDVSQLYEYDGGDGETMWLDEYGTVDGYSTVKYQRTETTEEWGWKNILEGGSDNIIDYLNSLAATINPSNDYLNFSSNLANAKIKLNVEVITETPQFDIDYSFDRLNWQPYTVGEDIIIPNAGDKVYLRGNNDCFSKYDYDEEDYAYKSEFDFSTTSQGTFKIYANGNINSLLSKTDYNNIVSLKEFCYNEMFAGCTNLTTAPDLPATTLANRCYIGMFRNCRSLTTAPKLPATTLASGCYYGMFAGCTSLTTAPSILPATTLANECYFGMFRNCSSLTTAPELPATTLTSKCYQNMFQNCSLNYIKCLATNISASNCTTNWVFGVQTNSGTFVKSPNATSWTTGANGIPTNWTVENGGVGSSLDAYIASLEARIAALEGNTAAS